MLQRYSLDDAIVKKTWQTRAATVPATDLVRRTDRGGFIIMSVGMKNTSVSWTVPSTPSPVHPRGIAYWFSSLGDVDVLDFRIQFSTDKKFEETKADW